MSASGAPALTGAGARVPPGPIEISRLTPETRLLAGTPGGLLAALAGALGLAAALVAVAGAPIAILQVAAVVAGHGALLATAVSWSAADCRRAGWRPPSPLAPVAILLAGSAASKVHALGALLYLVFPLWLGWQSREGRLTALGLGTPLPLGGLASGVLVGAFLGSHVLFTASLTLGHRPGGGTVAAVLAAMAYDVGAQVPATECFFRGALFNRAQRRWSFAVAAALSTVASLTRYLIDPRLPGVVEVVVGMAFYVSLLSVANAWLLWRFGTLVPGLVSAILFFTAYRVVTGG